MQWKKKNENKHFYRGDKKVKKIHEKMIKLLKQ